MIIVIFTDKEKSTNKYLNPDTHIATSQSVLAVTLLPDGLFTGKINGVKTRRLDAGQECE